jgi:hypothetical protein
LIILFCRRSPVPTADACTGATLLLLLQVLLGKEKAKVSTAGRCRESSPELVELEGGPAVRPEPTAEEPR